MSIVPVVNNSSNTAGEVPGDAAVAAATSGKVAAEGRKWLLRGARHLLKVEKRLLRVKRLLAG